MLRVTVGQDYDAESPNEWDSAFRVVSFDKRSVDYVPVEDVFGCAVCGGLPDDCYGEEDEYYGPHEYTKTELLGQALYGLYDYGTRDGFRPTPDGVPDVDEHSGVLLGLDEQIHADHKANPEATLEWAKAFCETYAAWATGNVFWFSVEKPVTCEACSHVSHEDVLEYAVGGFYGDKDLMQGVREELSSLLGKEPAEIFEDEDFVFRYVW